MNHANFHKHNKRFFGLIPFGVGLLTGSVMANNNHHHHNHHCCMNNYPYGYPSYPTNYPYAWNSPYYYNNKPWKF